MKKITKALALTVGISLSMGALSPNLHAEGPLITRCMRTYILCKNSICNYMSSRHIGDFLDFFVLGNNLHLLPQEDRETIASHSKNISKSLNAIKDAFHFADQNGKAEIAKNILKEYCNHKRYNYIPILNIVNSHKIANCSYFPFQNASIEPEIYQQHGMELTITFYDNLTDEEKDLFFVYGITCEDNEIYFGI